MSLECDVNGINFKNPVVLASGIVRYGQQFDNEVGLESVGGIITKTVTRRFREGNPAPRVTEVDCGMMNSIGLANPGIEHFIEKDLPFHKVHKTNVIVSIGADNVEDMVFMASRLDALSYVDGVELNLSCPNVRTGMQCSQVPQETKRFVSAVRDVTDKTLVAKLSPNVSDVVTIARAAVNAGADALSLVNTLAGIKVDARTRKFVLGNIIGGLSGPAIRPVGVKMVYDVKKALDIPVIAHGGVVDHLSALEYILVGADLVAVGSGLFKDPLLTRKLIDGLVDYLRDNSLTLDQLKGVLL